MNSRLSGVLCGWCGRLATVVILSAVYLWTGLSAHAGYVTAFKLNAVSYSAAEGSTISGTVTRYALWDDYSSDWNLGSSAAVTLFLSNAGHTYPISVSDLAANWQDWAESVTVPANQYSANFTIPFNQNTNVYYDRTATLSVGGRVDPNQIQDATITLLDDDNPVYATIYFGGENYDTVTSILEGGQSGANTATIRILRSSAEVQARTINYVMEGTASGSDYSASPSLTNSVTIPQGSYYADFTITALADSTKEGNETLILRLTSGAYQVDANWTNVTVTLVDDYPTVTMGALTNQLAEGASTTVFFDRAPAYYYGPDKTINFQVSGTASNGVDFTFPSTMVITSGWSYAALPLSALNDSVVEGVENLTITLSAGVYDIGSSSNVTFNLLDDYPTVNVTATTGTAQEPGAVPGVFTFQRTGNLDHSVTAQYQVSGTAVAGTHYQSLSGSVTFNANQTSTNVTVTPIDDSVYDGARTVVVTLQTNTSYWVGLRNEASITIRSGGEANGRTAMLEGRYYRARPHPADVLGELYTWDDLSSVLPLDDEIGVWFDDVDGPLATNFVNRAWTDTRYHVDWYNWLVLELSQTTVANRLAFNNPIVAFGGGHGGSPLFLGQRYSLGVYAGDPAPDYTPIRIAVYNRTNGAYAGEVLLPVPNPNDTANWTNYAAGGFEKTVEGYGLKTTLRHTPQLDWGAMGDGAYVLTHEAGESAQGYYYLVEATGYLGGTPTALTSGGTPTASRLYTLEFEPRPAWRAMFLDQPHFAKTPLPPVYDGKSPQEMLLVQAQITNEPPSSALTYTNLNQSPELRRHPLLDQLTADLRRDPLAIANYVQNEIELTDPIGLNDDGSQAEQAVNLGGVNRSALGVYLEGQGSPIEQCALLVYLLRSANIPATYVFAPTHGVQLLDERLSRLLRVRLVGGRDRWDQLFTTNSLISVNYPWVAAYVNDHWVHLFPWLKDHEAIEGMDLRDVLPAEYPDAFSWVRDYVLGNTNLLSYGSVSDQTLGYIYPRWLAARLQETAPGLSVEDLGLRWRIRPHSRARWEDFPLPTQVTNTFTAVESLSSTGITNVSPALTNVFNTVSVEIYSQANPQKSITTPALRMADLNDRKFYLTHVTNGLGHQLQLNLAAFGTNTTGTGAFTDADLLRRQQLTLDLDNTDDQLKVRFVFREHRAITPEQPVVPNLAFLDLKETRVFAQERPLHKGDLAGLCLVPGRVTKRMLDVHARELWQMESALNGSGTADPDIYHGTLVYLMGMSYFERVGRGQRWIYDLTKMQNLSALGMGLSKFSATRDAYGQVTGQPDFTRPAVDMFHYEAKGIGNGTARLDSGHNAAETGRDALVLLITDLSSQEHQTLNVFLRETNAVSTVRLLQLAQSRATNGSPGVIFLNSTNLSAEGAVAYQGAYLNQSDVWPKVVDLFNESYDRGRTVGFITPGAVTNDSGSFRGLGFLGLGFQHATALIGENLNGAYASYLEPGALGSANAGNIAVRQDAEGNYYTSFDAVNDTFRALAPGSTLSFDRDTVASGAENGYYVTTGAQNLQSSTALDHGLISTGGGSAPGELYGALVQAEYDRGDAGNVSAYNKVGGLVADPVSPITGEFYHDAVDLTLPGPFPLQLRRNYSSQNLADNQFGHGWKINYLPFLSVSLDGNLIYAAELDGSTLAYERDGTNDLWRVTASRNPMLDNNSTHGIGSTANRLGQYLVLTNSAYTLHGSDGSVRTYQLSPFTSAPANKPFLTRWQDHRGNELTFEYVTDTTQPDFGELCRIQAANGNALGFYFDAAGHILEAYTGDGRRVKYDYDQFGDLVKVTRPDNSEISFEYQQGWQNVTNGGAVSALPYSTHLITREIKPDGRILENQYDNQRRVTNQLATVGLDLTPVRNASFIYSNNFALTNSYTNTVTGYTLIVDVFYHTNRYDYSNSLITKITDPLDQYREQLWYADSASAPGYPRSLYRQRDLRGLWTEFKYDNSGNVTNTVTWGDLTGDGTTSYATNTVTYNANNLPLETTDAIGNKVATVYDSAFPFLPQQVIRYAGATPVSTNQFTYYNVTNTFSSGGVTYTNLALGLLQQERRAFNSPDAATNVWTHDGRGFITQQVRYTGTPDPAVTNFFFYNDRGEVVERTDGVGRSTVFDHDGLGRPILREVYEAGASTPVAWEYSYYNENGELTWSDGPRFDPEDYVWRDYDGAGRQTTEIHWRSQARSDGSGVEAVPGDALYATTFQEYDAFGNLTRVIDPRGAVTTNIWDAIGRLVQRRSLDLNGSLLSSEGFAYEPGGKVAFHTNALSGVTETLYTTTGQPRHRLLPDGSTNGWRYYADGRLRREYQSNGAYWETTYDDSLRSAIKVFYTAGGGSALATNVTVLDRRGNVIRTVDVLGNSFTNVFDGLDRLRVTLGPEVSNVPPTNAPPALGGTPASLQLRTTNYFDAGVVTTNVNALGEKTITYTDALGRVTRTEIRDAANALVRESSTSYAQNHHSVTTTNGSGSTAILTTSYTDNDGRNVLSVSYPSSGATHFTLRDFDPSGNLVFEGRYARTNSAQTPFTSATYSYDGLNRLTEKIDRDTASTTFAYNAAGDLTNRVVPGGLSWNAAYSSAGQMLTNWNASAGGSVVRANGFTYYGSGSAFAGLLSTHTDARGVVRTDSYDDWLRVTNSAYSGSLAEQNLATSWQYDLRGLVTNIVEQFASTNTGPDTTIRRDYNPYGLLVQESVRFGTNNFYTGNAYNSVGRRASMDIGGFGASFTWRADGRLTKVDVPNFRYTDYGWDTAGWLTNRAAGGRNTTITSRDGTGRPLTVETVVNGVTELTETLAYTGDGLIRSHNLDRSGDFLDIRRYTYADQSRRLIQEKLSIDDSTSWTNVFTYDSGTEHGPGVLTRIAQPGSGAAWDAHVDAHLRIDRETNNVVRRLAYGHVNMQPNFGYATLGVALNGRPVPFLSMGTSNTNWPARWQAQIELTPGTHTLTATAVHPSGMYTNTATVTFTNQAFDQTVLTYYSEGQLTQRVWKNSQGATNRVETYQWDARGRLHGFTERDVNGDGHDWSAVYDAFNRKLQTQTVPVTNSVAYASQLKTVTHLYDPLTEFMDLGVRVDGRWHWKVYGPDLSGEYGGLNGTGGWDATITGPATFYPTIQDVRGNILGACDPTTGVQWNKARVTAYGSIPEHRPRSLGEGVSLWEAGSYRGRFPELSGHYIIGHRPYQPVGGSFIAADFVYDPRNQSDFSFCGGDPVNYTDPNGLFGKAAYADMYTFADRNAEIYARWGLTYGQPGGSFNVGRFATDTVFNQSDIAAAWELTSGADYTTVRGWGEGIVGTIGGLALTADAAFNVASFGIKGAVTGAAKTGVKELAAVGTKEISTPLFSRIGGEAMDPALFQRVQRAFERHPGRIMQADANSALELERFSTKGLRVEGQTLNQNVVFLRPNPSTSSVYEELIHTAQLRRGMNPTSQWRQMEIEAAEKLIRFADRYKISPVQTQQTIERLNRLRQQAP